MLLAFHPVSIMGLGDLNSKYPKVDTGVGICYATHILYNQGYVRFGPFVAWDINPDLTRSDWGSLGIFLGREIQRNVILGGTVGFRFGELKGLQWGIFVGIDVIPWLK